MKLDLNNLPNNPKSLHQIIADLSSEIISLKNQLALLKAKKFGKSSEKIDQEKLEKEIANLELQVEEEEEKTSSKIIDDLTKESESQIGRAHV